MIKFPKLEGCEFYLVGGCVRDYLMDKEPKDKDFVVLTNYSFDRLAEEIDQIGTVYIKKPEFLTIRCNLGEPIDISFPRSDHNYEDGRHPSKVNRVNTLKEDASRRDFTINAMFMDKDGKIIDHFGGKLDLQTRIIRTVGTPYLRFKEDYLRILRAVRFSCKYRLNILPNTYRAMIRNSNGLRSISMDRIRDELNKSFKIDPYSTFKYIETLKIWDILKEKNLKIQLTNRDI